MKDQEQSGDAAEGKGAKKKGTPNVGGGKQVKSQPVDEEVGDFGARLGDASRHVSQDVDALSQSLGDAAQEVTSYVRHQCRERPYVAVGTALGIGFVLGGGLTLRVGSLLLGAGGRLVANALLREVLQPSDS